jgi:uncharacterized membrane protein YbhN (UPF0104 family)
VARLARRIRVPGLAWLRRKIWKNHEASRYLLSQARYEHWLVALESVDAKMRVGDGARVRDRWLGIAAVVQSRASSMSLSLLILHAVGESITGGFIAAYTVGGFVIYMMSSLVPMGLGISEGGNYWLFRALGENPARGVTLVFARRATLVVYAGIGFILVAASETVARARSKQAQAAVAEAPPKAVVVAHPPAPVPLPEPMSPAPVIDAAE